MGRKNKYETHVQPHLADIRAWYGTLSEEAIAKRLGVSRGSFENYKKSYPELQDCLRAGKEALIEDLKTSLKQKAKGFRYKETKRTTKTYNGHTSEIIEEYDRYSPPDTGAIHLLLKNLDPEWRNDDKATMDLKRERLELDKQKAEDSW